MCLIKTSAHPLKPLWHPFVMKKGDIGCFSDHASQVQDEEAKISFFLNALDMVNWKKDYWKHLFVVHIPHYLQCYDDKNWIWHIWCQTERKEKWLQPYRARVIVSSGWSPSCGKWLCHIKRSWDKRHKKGDEHRHQDLRSLSVARW